MGLRKNILLKYKKYILKKKKNTIVKTSHIPLAVMQKIGSNCWISEEVQIYKDTVEIGDYSYINGGKIFYSKIGKFCSIGYNVFLGSGEHSLDKISTFPVKNKVCNIAGLVDFPEQKDTIIGNDVWIGNNVCIKQGVNIGDGSIIASGAVVTHDVQPYSIVGGVPAKLIRFRFDKAVREILTKIEWWNWDFNRLKDSILNDEFDNVEKFIEKYKNNIYEEKTK